MKITITSLFILIFSLAIFGQDASVIAENANLRGTPNQSGKVVDTLPQGASLQVIQQKGAWFLVQTSDYVGWIHGDTIKYTSSASTAPLMQPIVVPIPRPTSSPATTRQTSTPKSSSNSYIRGPRGGCFYYTASGRKQYVDRSLCN